MLRHRGRGTTYPYALSPFPCGYFPHAGGDWGVKV